METKKTNSTECCDKHKEQKEKVIKSAKTVYNALLSHQVLIKKSKQKDINIPVWLIIVILVIAPWILTIGLIAMFIAFTLGYRFSIKKKTK